MSIQDVSLSMPPRAPSWRIKALAFASDNKLFVFGALLLLLIMRLRVHAFLALVLVSVVVRVRVSSQPTRALLSCGTP